MSHRAPKTVLLIDDSERFRSVVATALKRAGYAVVEAADGQAATELLGSAHPNIIVCDVIMPRMDGLAFARHLKATPPHQFTPVIMLTTASQQDREAEAKAVGVSAWITKPIQPSQLVDAIERLCP